jgi:hypothetical protein
MTPEQRQKKIDYMKAWHKANREAQKAYYIVNKEKHAATMKKWRETNKEKHAALCRAWRLNNLDRHAAKESKRRAKKLLATPEWLTQQHLLEIQEWYILAKELQWLSNEPLHVDHIVPLVSKEVCGLHVPWNLQILPMRQNISKGNKITQCIIDSRPATPADEVKE